MEEKFVVTAGALTKYEGENPTVIIPESILDIKAYAFIECGEYVKHIHIPASVCSIGVSVFTSCPCLEEITVAEDNVAYCAVDGVLYNKDMTKLIRYPKGKTGTFFRVPDTVTELVKYSFYCSSVEEVDATSVKSIGEHAFDGCTKLHTVFPLTEHACFTPTTIYAYAFANCEELREIFIPNEITHLGKGVFDGCHSLQTVHFPPTISIHLIREETFGNCWSLEHIAIPEGIRYIGEFAFHNCVSLRDVSFPDTLVEIQNYAFSMCGKLPWIKFPSQLEYIGASAFASCEKLESVEIPDSVTRIDNKAFQLCKALREVKLGKELKKIGAFAFQMCALTNVRLPRKLNDMPRNAFEQQVDIL